MRAGAGRLAVNMRCRSRVANRDKRTSWPGQDDNWLVVVSGERAGDTESGPVLTVGDGTDRRCTVQVLTPACGVFTLLSQHVRAALAPVEVAGADSSGSGPSRSRAQSTESLGRPASLEASLGRHRAIGPGPRARLPHSAARRVRSHEASAGLSPPVDTDTVTAPVPVHRREDERGVGEVVGAVGPDAGGLGVCVDRTVDVRDPGGGDDQAKGRCVARARRAVARARRSDGTSASMSSLNEGAITVTSAPHWSSARALRAATVPTTDNEAGAAGDVERDRVEGEVEPGLSHGAAAARPCPPRWWRR